MSRWYALGGQGKVSAVMFSTYWFVKSVNEVTSHPRPASFRSTTTVETDHPLYEIINPALGPTHKSSPKGAEYQGIKPADTPASAMLKTLTSSAPKTAYNTDGKGV